jgi:hypothetical protein
MFLSEEEVGIMRSLSCLLLLTVVNLASAQIPEVPLPPPQPVPFLPTVPTMPAPAIVPVVPMTVADFVASFKPLPGKYEVLLIHPKTGCPVKVCFTLPPGCLRTVRSNTHKIVFVYKCQHDVVIRFLHSGNVWVRG